MTVIIECLWCDAPVALGDRDVALACDNCGVVTEFVSDEAARLAEAA